MFMPFFVRLDFDVFLPARIVREFYLWWPAYFSDRYVPPPKGIFLLRFCYYCFPSY